jgi:hypothetical protein
MLCEMNTAAIPWFFQMKSLIEDLVGFLHRQMIGWLVKNDNLRLEVHRASDHDRLPLTTREITDRRFKDERRHDTARIDLDVDVGELLFHTEVYGDGATIRFEGRGAAWAWNASSS